jgi:predicted TIM-barrel fold metal-dependent hydrolase
MSSVSGDHDPSGRGGEEEIVLPDLPIVDSHIHLWNLTGFDYFVPDYLADVGAGHNVQASVYVECGMSYSDDERIHFRPVGETAYVLEQVKQSSGSGHNLAAAILGSADLTLGAAAVRPLLQAHIEAGKGRFRGIRSRVAWDADPQAGYGNSAGYPKENILLTDSFLEGARCLAELGLVLDVWAFHTQLNDLAKFAARCPELKLLINHVGGPLGVGRYAGKREEVFSDWARGIREVARVPNVHIKLSGLGISRLGFRFQGGGQASSSDELVQAWQPYVTTCVEAFGPDRAIFGSNFPVDRAAAPYRILLNAFKKMLQGSSDDERCAIFAGNARRFYNIP